MSSTVERTGDAKRDDAERDEAMRRSFQRAFLRLWRIFLAFVFSIASTICSPFYALARYENLVICIDKVDAGLALAEIGVMGVNLRGAT